LRDRTNFPASAMELFHSWIVRGDMRYVKPRFAIKIALMTLFIVGFFALFLGNKFHQHSWIEKNIKGAADTTGSPP
jgi:hypothetical protein